MKRIVFVAFAMTACAPVAALPGMPSGKCSIAKLDNLIGQQATLGSANDARTRSGAATTRAIGPGQAVTMDYRKDRLNIYLDDKGAIVRFTCG